MVVLNNQLYVIGGKDPAERSVERLDDNAWTTLNKGLQGAFFWGGSIVVE